MPSRPRDLRRRLSEPRLRHASIRDAIPGCGSLFQILVSCIHQAPKNLRSSRASLHQHQRNADIRLRGTVPVHNHRALPDCHRKRVSPLSPLSISSTYSGEHIGSNGSHRPDISLFNTSDTIYIYDLAWRSSPHTAIPLSVSFIHPMRNPMVSMVVVRLSATLYIDHSRA